MLFRIVLFILGLLSSSVKAEDDTTLRRQADSLRLCGFYQEEVLLRDKIGILDFDQQLVHIHLLIGLENYQEARTLIEQLSPTTSEQHFWKRRVLSLVYAGENMPDKALELLETVSAPTHLLLKATYFLDLANLYSKQDNDSKVIELLEQTVQMLDQSPYRNHYKNSIALSDLAYAYDKLGMGNKVVNYANRALRLLLNYYPRHAGMISTVHNNFLFYAIEYGDTKIATDIYHSYEKFMTHYLANKSHYMPLSKHHDVHAEALYRLSSIRFYGYIQEEEQLVKAMQLLEDFFKQAPQEWKQANLGILSAGYELLPYTFRLLKKFPQALHHAAFIDKAEKKPYNLMKKHAAYALIYYDAKNYELAYEHVNACLNAYTFAKGSRSLQTLMVLKAELLANMGRLQEAEAFLRSLYEEIVEVNPIDYYDIQIGKYPQHINKFFLNVLIHSGWIYQSIYGQRGKQVADYRLARQFFLLAAQTFDLYYQRDLNNKSLAELIAQIEDGLSFESHLLSQSEIKEHLQLIERFKGAHLWNKFTSKYIENLNLPREILEQKNTLQLQRNLITRTFEQEIKNRSKVDSIDRELQLLEKHLSRSNPEFIRFNGTSISISDLQKQLSPQQAIIRYSYGEEFVYAHIITNQSVQVTRLTDKKSLEPLVSEYMQRIKHIRSDYLEIKPHLQRLLIQPLVLTGLTNLRIISEGFISQLPFETLFSSPVTISYNYSLKSIQQLDKPTTTRLKNNLVGFVPMYTQYDATPLHFTTKELKGIEQFVPRTDLYLHKEATKSNFLNSLNDYTIHHLAMHSEVNELDYEQSSLVFQNQEKVYFHELYALNFPAQLVVLGACNTAVGQYLDGEGVMSFARALHYAGVSSTVTSLWPVPDKESADLMKLFYEELAQGTPKDQALMHAKSQFQVLYPMKTHPYYWAGYILTGDTAAIELKKTSPALYYWALAIALCVGTMYYYQRSTTSILSKIRK